MRNEYQGPEWLFSEESLAESVAIARALKPEPAVKLQCRTKLSKVGLKTEHDAEGRPSYYLSDPDATGRFVRSLIERFKVRAPDRQPL